MSSPEEIFRAYFLPLYPEGARDDAAIAVARSVDANPAKNPSVSAHLDEAAAIFASRAPALFGEDTRLDFSDASVHRLSVALTEERVARWASAGAAGTPASELFNVAVHGAAYVGACIVKRHGGVWGLRRPLWESVVRLASRAGEADLAVFHWWLKSLAAPGTHALADRYRAHVEIPTFDAERLPILASPGRAIPRLAKVRYDTLYKHLKAHVPELRDLGEHFPSPERFAELGFKWLDFAIVGGGRMLVVHGPSQHGVHILWLGASGFEKSAFYPADAFPEHRVKLDGDTIALLVSVAKKLVVHEMLWWGP